MQLLKLKLIEVPQEQFYVMHKVKSQQPKRKQHGSIPDALAAKAYAYRDAMLMIKDLGLSKVIVETDNQELVALWNSTISNRKKST